MISADIKVDVKQEIKELVAASYNFPQKYLYYEENVQNKHKRNKTKTNKVSDTKTVENIKYEPILSRLVP